MIQGAFQIIRVSDHYAVADTMKARRRMDSPKSCAAFFYNCHLADTVFGNEGFDEAMITTVIIGGIADFETLNTFLVMGNNTDDVGEIVSLGFIVGKLLL